MTSIHRKSVRFLNTQQFCPNGQISCGYTLAAEQGDAIAQSILGTKLDLGEGVPEDDAEAARWWRLAAEQGEVEAQFNLGTMYANGQGVPEDDVEAVRWYRLSAEQGHAGAQNNLGVKYATGQGVPEDPVQAYAWASIAMAQGHKSKLKEKLARNMTQAQLAKAQKLSREYWDLYVVPFRSKPQN